MKLLHIITAACANMSNRFGHVMHIKAKRQMLQEIQVKKKYVCVLNESCLIVIVYCCATLCVCVGRGHQKHEARTDR